MDNFNFVICKKIKDVIQICDVIKVSKNKVSDFLNKVKFPKFCIPVDKTIYEKLKKQLEKDDMIFVRKTEDIHNLKFTNDQSLQQHISVLVEKGTGVFNSKINSPKMLIEVAYYLELITHLASYGIFIRKDSPFDILEKLSDFENGTELIRMCNIALDLKQSFDRYSKILEIYLKFIADLHVSWNKEIADKTFQEFLDKISSL